MIRRTILQDATRVFSADRTTCRPSRKLGTCIKGKKVKEVDLYSAFIVVPHTQGAQVWITQCYLRITLYLPLPRISIHQMAHPQTEVADI